MQCVVLKFKFLLLAIIIADQSKLSQLSPITNQRNEPPKTWKKILHTGTYIDTRIYLNPNDYVAIYLTSKSNQIKFPDPVSSTTPVNSNWFTATESPNWLFNFASNAWSYMKKIYGEFGPNPYLNLVFHPECHLYNPYFEFSIAPSQDHNFVHIPFPSWNSPQKNLIPGDALDLLTNAMAYFVERSSKQHYGSPSYNVWKIPAPAGKLDFTAWSDIFTFDIYKNLNLVEHAQRYKNRVVSDVNLIRKTWFQNWFLPIYEFSMPGGNFVLNQYFQILSENSILLRNVSDIRISNNNYISKGAFVHFWSIAANADLKNLTRDAFGWSDDNEQEYVAARHLFPYSYKGELITSAEEEPKVIKKVAKNGVVVGSVAVGIIIFLILVLVASFIFYKKKIQKLQSEISVLTTEEVKNFFEGDGNVGEDKADEALVLSIPFIKDFEIPRDQMILDPTKVLGTGQFGTVIHGFLRQNETDPLMSVAMKTVKPNVDVSCFKAFLSEVKIMAYLGRHDNIVDLLGTCTTNIKNREIFIALEFCPRGNLLDYLKNNRENFQRTGTVTSGQPLEVNESTHTTSGKQNIITNSDLIRWSHEISNAMMYLTVKKVIHGDLAARNILLTETRTAKISDFGLSRQFLNYANYMKTSKLPVPWRWLAIESLKEMNFSTASDVWAFGVTMWEIFSLGEVPYGAWTFDLFFVDKLVAGERLLIPTHATQSIYEMMKECWDVEPSKRPKFQQIHNLLGKMIGTPTPTEVKSPEFKGNKNEEGRRIFNNKIETQL